MEKVSQHFYLGEIEEFFLSLTKKGVSLSPDDIAVVLSWQRFGVPIECVKRGVKKGIEKFLMASDPEARLPTKLRYYRHFVEEEFRVFQRAKKLGLSSDSWSQDSCVDILEIATKAIQNNVMQKFESVAKEAIQKLKDGINAGHDVSLVLQEVDEFIAIRILEASDAKVRQRFEEAVSEKEKMAKAKGLQGSILESLRSGEAIRFVEKVFGIRSLCDEVLRQVKVRI